jgi:hypothetical protein
MTMWEYWCENLDKPEPSLQTRLNQLGARGWELVKIDDGQNGGWFFVMKRPVVQKVGSEASEESRKRGVK